MSVILYTLPNCGICKMAKAKLQQKNILYEEKPFQDIAAEINSDHAPALKTEDGNIYNSPAEIVNWINQQ